MMPGYHQKTLNNKRIAKNTILLYVRMLLIMAVGLYTSRVTLNALGIVDYGLNNVVGGVVTMFAFLNTAMVSASQRYITFGLAQDDLSRIKTIFTTSFQIHVIIAFLIVILGETVGLWFVYNKMVIPPERMNACLWVYHLSIVTMVSSIISVPYNSAIIAHEKMGAFASISIIEAILKLVIAYLLVVSIIDKLILYAILIALVQIIIQLFYTFYCNKYFEETSLIKIIDRPLIKEMGLFASWNLVGNLAVTLCGQGLNLLVNMFFGPAINAARAVAVQIDATVDRFSANFLTAVNPQLTKLYAQNNRNDMMTLFYRSSKIAFFLIFSLSLPLLIEAEFVLTLWLKTVPDYSVPFVRYLLVIAIINTVARPSITLISATGNIKKYQMIVGGLLLTIVPISYIVLKLGGNPNSVYVVYLVVNLIVFFVRIGFVKTMLDLSIKEYFNNVILRCLVVMIAAILVSYVTRAIIGDSTLSIIIFCFFSFLIVVALSYLIGMTYNERLFIKTKVISFLSG